MAKFEVCGHKYVDFSEFGYGVTLVNDSKYGFAVSGNVMSMSILKAPKSPDQSCDIGRQEFRYGLIPHKGGFEESRAVQEGYEFNVELVKAKGGMKVHQSFLSSDKENVVIDTIKRAQKSELLLMRVYESCGGRGVVKIKRFYVIDSVQ
jgi:alpha-mannosidase